MSKDVKSLIRGARLPETTVPVCLQADLVAEFEAAERELADAQRTNAGSLAAGSKARQVAERLEAIREEMTAATIEFRLRAMTRTAWREFIAEHPPRKAASGAVDERDKFIGVNVDSFFPELVRRSVVAPQLDAEDWSLLLDEKLTDRQFDALSDAAWSLNRREVDVPFSPAASRILRTSETE